MGFGRSSENPFVLGKAADFRVLLEATQRPSSGPMLFLTESMGALKLQGFLLADDLNVLDPVREGI